LKLTLTGGSNQNALQLNAGNTVGAHAFYVVAGSDLIVGADKGFAILDATSGYAGRFFIDATTGLTSIYAGLSVTGTLSTTGSVGVGAAATSGTLHVTSAGGAFGDYQLALTRTSVGTTTLRVGGSNELIIAPNGTDRASFTTSGAAITGTLSATGVGSFGGAGTIGGLRLKQSADTFAGGLVLQQAATLDSWQLAASSNSLYIGYATNASGADAAGDFTVISIFSSTGLAVTGALSCTGALSKGSGSFRIEHPLPSKSATHQLVHSFIEGPKCDLIYRGKVDLVDGKATVNIDTDSTMTEGTFEVLCANVQCFTSNESGWGAIRGKVVGNILTIEAQDSTSTDNVSWMVIGERKDKHILDTDWTDSNGRPIVEPLKPAEAEAPL
jgi:hypothetical protein